MAFTEKDKSMLEGYIASARPFADMYSVKGRVALVTGGSSGLGFDITLRLLQGGAKVMMASNSRIEEEAAMSLLEKEGYKDSVKFCFTDVRNEDEVKQLVDHTVETFGGLDIFVNSAAIWNYAKVYDLPKEDLQLVFETNVYGAFYGVKHVSRYMIDHEVRGKIVLISSNSPIMPYPVFGGYPHYASSKAAVMGLTTEAAKELKRYGIMINSIAPGGMVTPGAAGNMASENISEEKQDEFYEELMIWQVDGQLPVDQVGMMAYTFCTDVADGITGETVVVDGGATHNIVKYQVAIDAFPEES